MTYRIHNWKDRSKYPSDPLTGAPAAFIEERQECGQSKDEIRLALWRWQFLRRHELYQDHWENDGDEYSDAFGVGGVPRPSPKGDFPIDLLFKYEQFNKHLRYPTFIDVQKSWAENEIRLKQLYDLFRASTSGFELAIASLYMPKKNLMEERERQPSEKKYPIFLQVLDALADGVTITEIAENFGTSHNTASRWRDSALDLQAAFTGLPRMSKSHK